MFVGSSSGVSGTYRHRGRSAPTPNFALAQPNESGMQIIAVSGPMATAALRSALPQTRSVFPDICRSGTQCPKPPDTQQYGVEVRVPVMSSVASFAHTLQRRQEREDGGPMGSSPADHGGTLEETLERTWPLLSKLLRSFSSSRQ